MSASTTAKQNVVFFVMHLNEALDLQTHLSNVLGKNKYIRKISTQNISKLDKK